MYLKEIIRFLHKQIKPTNVHVDVPNWGKNRAQQQSLQKIGYFK